MKLPAFLAAGLVLLAACQNQSAEQKDQSPGYESADTMAVAGNGITPKLVKKAQLQFEVASVQQGSRAIGQLARGLGGSVTQIEIKAEEGATRTLPRAGGDSLLQLQTLHPTASLAVQVPAGRLEEFLYGAAQLSSFSRYSSLTIDDNTLAYLETQWRAEARKKMLAGPRTVKRYDSTGLALTDDIITRRIGMESIDAQVRYSTVTLQLDQPPLVRRSVICNTDLDAYGLPFGQRMRDALESGWQLFARVLLAGAHLWVFIVLAILGWTAWRRRGRPWGAPVKAG
ncbi:DUF4349 domain-containing protein [Flaviaesturariibacter flavus]|uniref:DUF4349 domain-containing protein n=1 Tax=Flaviaesturariibacter flavus TaxID=2502780 RepID=A0A4R1B4X1_9BACT|nr:DUF4349 domain-containing protein [Flaviaesturariibacter flavus]TCJ13164.1 DUF4349 domain-containing protein [Flaviaesturariibacter flavus]